MDDKTFAQAVMYGTGVEQGGEHVSLLDLVSYDTSFIRNIKQAQRWAEQYPLGAYYRLEEVQYYAAGVEVQVGTYEVLKHTPTGARINDYRSRAHGKGRLISRNWNKQWACPTIDEAIKSFVARKTRQILIYEARIRTAKEALQIINAHLTTEK
jgi:hypothetical protein